MKTSSLQQSLSQPLYHNKLVTLLAILMLFALSGCGATSEGNSSGSADTETEADTGGAAAEDADTDAADTEDSSTEDSSTDAASPEPVEMRIAVQQPGLTTYFPLLAEDLGYLAEEGITLAEVVETRDSPSAITGMMGGSLELVAIGPEGMIAHDEGADIVAVAGGINTPIWSAVSVPEIEEWSDITPQHSIGVSGLDSIPTLAFRMAAREAGVDDSELTYVTVGGSSDRLAALMSDQVDVVSLSSPFDFVAEAEGFNNLGFGHGDETEFLSYVLNTPRSWAEENSDALVRFLRAYLKTVEYMNQPENRDDLVERSARLLETDADEIRKGLDRLLDSPLYMPLDGKISEEAYDSVMQAYLEAGVLSEPVPFEEHVDHSYLEQAAQSR